MPAVIEAVVENVVMILAESASGNGTAVWLSDTVGPGGDTEVDRLTVPVKP